MTQQEDRGPARCVVGLLADPEAPTKLANRLARTLPGRLADGNLDLPPATIDVVSEPFTTGTEDASTLLDRIEEHAEGRGWAVTIGLTELPLHAERRHLVADVDTSTGSALVSIPALGGIRLHSAALSGLGPRRRAGGAPYSAGRRRRRLQRPGRRPHPPVVPDPRRAVA